MFETQPLEGAADMMKDEYNVLSELLTIIFNFDPIDSLVNTAPFCSITFFTISHNKEGEENVIHRIAPELFNRLN